MYIITIIDILVKMNYNKVNIRTLMPGHYVHQIKTLHYKTD